MAMGFLLVVLLIGIAIMQLKIMWTHKQDIADLRSLMNNHADWIAALMELDEEEDFLGHERFQDIKTEGYSDFR